MPDTLVALSSLTMQMEGAVRDKLDRFGANILIVPRADQLSLGFGDIAVLARASDPDTALSFVAFVLSEEGAAILERHGFGAP